MLGAGLIRGDERQIDIGLGHGRQLGLGFLGRFLEPLQRHPILAQIDSLVLAEFVGQVIHDALIEIFAAEEGVAVGRLDLEHAFAQFENRNIEGAAAEIEDRDLFVLLLVEAVRQRCRRRLVDNSQHVQARDAAGIFGRLPLAVVEVRGHGDNGLGDFLAEVVLGRLLHLLQNERGNFRRAVFLAADFDPRRAVVVLHDLVRQHLERLLNFGVIETPAHQALDRKNCVGWIGDRLALGDLTDQPLARLRECDNRRRRATAFGVGDHYRVAALHDRDATVRRAQVDTDYFCHVPKDPLI